MKPSMTISLAPYRPCLKRCCAANARSKIMIGRTNRGNSVAIVRVVLVPQLQRIDQRIGQRTDADLQGAAVTHQRACMQAEREFSHIDRFARQREQCFPACRVVEHDIEEVHVNFCIVADERQIRMDHAHHQRPRARPAGGNAIEQIRGDIGIGCKAVTRVPAIFACVPRSIAGSG